MHLAKGAVVPKGGLNSDLAGRHPCPRVAQLEERGTVVVSRRDPEVAGSIPAARSLPFSSFLPYLDPRQNRAQQPLNNSFSHASLSVPDPSHHVIARSSHYWGDRAEEKGFKRSREGERYVEQDHRTSCVFHCFYSFSLHTIVACG
jgi:hypothetical protein